MKKWLAALLVIFALRAAGQDVNDCAVSEFRLDPPTVRAGQSHDMILSGTCGSSDVPRSGRARVEGNTILIDFYRSGAGLTVPTRFSERVVIGALPAGTYTVLARDPFGSLGHTRYTVGDPFTVKPAFGVEGTEVIIEGVEMSGCPDAAVPSMCAPWQVRFGNNLSPRVEVTERGEVIATVPQGSGRVDVTVINSFNESFTFPRAFTYGQGFEGDYERVLFPVNFAGRGAFGSDWHTEIIIANDGPVRIATVPLVWNSSLLVGLEPIPPGAEAMFPEEQRDGGAFLHVPRGLESRLSYASHIVDRSRTSTDLGTEVPVVRARDTANQIRLLEVPVGGLYRARLRIYDFDPENGRRVRITARRPSDGQVVYSRQVELTGAPVCPNAPCFAYRPPFASIDLDQIAEIRTAGEVDVTVDSLLADGRIWAFVSVTNNETQDVTLYSPQDPPSRR